MKGYIILGVVLSVVVLILGWIVCTYNKTIQKTNPYIYYKELPNHYGIGVTSLLFDSKIKNNKDIIAVILDLCARKYLSLCKENDTYHIKVLKDADNDYDLLSNEEYILNLVVSNKIKSINYNEWYNCCLWDGNALGLYYHDNRELNAILLPHSDFEIVEDAYCGITSIHLTRTEKGVIELQKLIAFQNFLSHFGSFVDKHMEDVVLWDRYLSYAQVFGLTKKIMKSGYKQLVENASFQIDDIDNIVLDNIVVS